MYTFQVGVSDLLNNLSTFIPPVLLDKPSRFSLDMSGIIGLLGGDDAISTIAAVHIYGNSRWLGWYNNPGSFQIATRLRSFTRSASLFSLFNRNNSTKAPSESVHTDPLALFELDSCRGPKFRAAHSGTVIEETGNIAALFMKKCISWDSDGKVIPGRRTQPVGITIVDLGQALPSKMRPAHNHVSTLLFATIPIAISLVACAISAVYQDWYASFLILLGIVASGVSSLVLGSADFVFAHPEPAKGSPAGDGILSLGKDIVLLRGTESAVNSITRGSFSLCFSNEGHHSLIRWCSFLFFLQAITQLLLITQASPFGQIMFLISLGVSALYNFWVSSQDREKIHQKLLFERVLENLTLAKYTLGTRTTAVVFMLLVLQLQDPTGLLNELLPNDTKVWKRWKVTIMERLHHLNDKSFQLRGKVESLDGFTQQERVLLQLLYDDAQAAYDGYRDYLRTDLL